MQIDPTQPKSCPEVSIQGEQSEALDPEGAGTGAVSPSFLGGRPRRDGAELKAPRLETQARESQALPSSPALHPRDCLQHIPPLPKGVQVDFPSLKAKGT